MYYSTYIPVNINRQNGAIHSRREKFAVTKLCEAHNLLCKVTPNCDEEIEEGVTSGDAYMEDGVVKFHTDLTIQWTIPEVFLAYEALKTARETNFCFYAVLDEEGIPQLFVSKMFKGHRMVVNAFTMKSILLGNKQLITKVASMIDHKVDRITSQLMFDTLLNMENGDCKYLSAVICNKGTLDEYMAVSPMTNLYSDYSVVYGIDYINEFKEIIDKGASVTESFTVTNERLTHNKLATFPPMAMEHVRHIVELYDKTKEKKSNYVELNSDEYLTLYYYSTNGRYLINATTFECVVVDNQNVKKLLTSFVTKGICSTDGLNLAWRLAKDSAGK